MSSLLTTRFLLKQQAGITDTANDTLIDRLIADISESVERRCDRVFGTATYTQWIDGSGTEKLTLPQTPINNIFMVSINVDDIMTVEFTGGEEASVSVNGSSVLLHSVSTAGVVTDTTLAIATYKTCTTMAAAISLIAGWSCVIEPSMSTRPTAMLRPMWSEDATSPTTAILTVASESEKVRVSLASASTIENVNYWSFPYGRQNIFVWYSAGYTLPVDNAGHTALETAGNLPGGLISAVNGIVADAFRSRDKNRTLNSESMGDYSYSNASGAVAGMVVSAVESHSRELSPYIRKSL